MLARLVVFAVCLSLATANANAGVIAYWDFNDQNLTVDQGSGTLTHDFEGTFSYFNGTTSNALDGVAAGKALAPKGGSELANNGKYLQFAIDTTNYSDITLSYATKRSDKGFNNNTVAYSDDAGASFTNFQTYDPATSFEVKSFDFSAIPNLNNNPDVVFRITFTGASNLQGNNRLDNVQIAGTAVPEPSSCLLFGFVFAAYIGYSFHRRRKRQRSTC